MKGKSIVEVVVVFALMKLFSRWADAQLLEWGVAQWWRSWFFGAQAIVIPCAILALARRDWTAYGFRLRGVGRDIHIGFIGVLLMMIAGLGFGVVSLCHLSYRGMVGSLVLVALTLVMIGLLLLVFSRSEPDDVQREPARGTVSWNLLIMVGMVATPLVVAALRGSLTPDIISWSAYYLVATGLGEETAYRGYFQSRVNQEFGRPFRVASIRFGPGLVVASLLFGLSHVGQMGRFNPFTGQYDLSWWLGLQAFFGAMFFGLLREKSGSILPSTLAHGVSNAFGELLGRVLGGE